MTKLLGARYWQSVGEVSGHISCGPGVLEIWSPRSLTEAAQWHRVQHIWHKVTTELEGIEDLKFPAVENQLSCYQTRAADWILPIVKSCEISGFLYTYTHILSQSSINHHQPGFYLWLPRPKKLMSAPSAPSAPIIQLTPTASGAVLALEKIITIWKQLATYVLPGPSYCKPNSLGFCWINFSKNPKRIQAPHHFTTLSFHVCSLKAKAQSWWPHLESKLPPQASRQWLRPRGNPSGPPQDIRHKTSAQDGTSCSKLLGWPKQV